MTTSIRDWAGLPEHILDLIVTKFGTLSYFFCFSSVCSKWRNYVNINPSVNIFFNILKLSRKDIPMLMIKTKQYNDDRRGLYNVLSGITYNVELPLSYKYRFIGSSHGWLFCLNKGMVITLLDPLNNGCISLPIFKDACQVFEENWNEEDKFDHYIHTAILTTDPRTTPNSYEVVVIYHGMAKLAYYKSGHQYWNFCNLVPERRYFSMDIICYRGCIYSVTLYSELLQIDFHKGTAKTVVPATTTKAHTLYLVESQDGQLLLVKRSWKIFYRDKNDSFFHKTLEFKVFKIVHSNVNEFAAWEEINNIGEQALFLGGSNHSMSVSTVECSKFLPNSIYYTPNAYLDVLRYEYQGVNEDFGIFNLEDKSFHSHQVLGPSEKYKQPPVWFVPKLI